MVAAPPTLQPNDDRKEVMARILEALESAGDTTVTAIYEQVGLGTHPEGRSSLERVIRDGMVDLDEVNKTIRINRYGRHIRSTLRDAQAIMKKWK